MYYDLNILEGTGIQFLKHQFLVETPYWVNLIPRNCAIVEWLLTSRYSGFWQNKHIFYFLFLIIVLFLPWRTQVFPTGWSHNELIAIWCIAWQQTFYQGCIFLFLCLFFVGEQGWPKRVVVLLDPSILWGKKSAENL